MGVDLQSTLSALLWAGGAIATTGILLLVAFQERIVYVPVLPGVPRNYPYTPQRLGLRYEDVWLEAADGVRLHAWLVLHPRAVDGPTILFFQENAGNIAHRLESVADMMSRLRCNVFMLSYRGYGASEGAPTERGITMDAQASLDYLLTRSDLDKNRIMVFGRSLGGAVGAKLVHDNPGKVGGLILENTFTSILDMAGKMVPWLKGVIGSTSFKPLNFLVRSQWRTIDIVGKIKTPILFISGLRDEMVPPEHMRRLYAVSLKNSNCQFVAIETGMHMDTWLHGGDTYWSAILTFLNKYASGREQEREGSEEDKVDEVEEDEEEEKEEEEDGQQ